jgi:hypothetical protein
VFIIFLQTKLDHSWYIIIFLQTKLDHSCYINFIENIFYFYFYSTSFLTQSTKQQLNLAYTNCRRLVGRYLVIRIERNATMQTQYSG